MAHASLNISAWVAKSSIYYYEWHRYEDEKDGQGEGLLKNITLTEQIKSYNII